MLDLLIGNFGKRNSVLNGQSQKAIQVDRLFRDRLIVNPKKIDSGDYLGYVLSFAQALGRGQSIALCVGPKGIRLASLLFSALAPIRARELSITLFVVGGWLPGLAARANDVAQLCRASRVLVEAQGLRDELATLDIASELFPNFRDLPILNIPRTYDVDNIRLIYCGRISTAKGAKRALKLLKVLRTHAPTACLDFYGPVEEPELAGQIDQAKGASYKGSFDDVSATAQIFPSYDFLVLPSAYPGECVPGAVVEAMFAGLPSIVSDWRFLPEIVHHGRTGFVCDLDAFGDRAAKLIFEVGPDAYSQMSEACLNQARETYSVETAVGILVRNET